MRRHSYTIAELLTVIAIIAILASIAIPTVGYARRRARRTACVSNQGQTTKLLLTAMGNHKNFLYSGSASGEPSTNGVATSKASWSRFLAEKDYIKNMDVLRCPEMDYKTNGAILNADSIKEAYGVVVADDSVDGKFDFRGSKLLTLDDTDKTKVAPGALVLGGCATKDKKPIEKLDPVDSGTYGNFTDMHSQFTNVFYYDGHSESVRKEELCSGRYYPTAKVKDGKLCLNAVAITEDNLVWVKAFK